MTTKKKKQQNIHYSKENLGDNMLDCHENNGFIAC